MRGAVLGSRGRRCTHNAGKVGVFRVRHGGGETGLGGRCSGRGEAGSGSWVKAAAKGAAEEAEEQEVSRQQYHRSKIKQKSREQRATTPLGRLGSPRTGPGNEVMAGGGTLTRIVGYVVFAGRGLGRGRL